MRGTCIKIKNKINFFIFFIILLLKTAKSDSSIKRNIKIRHYEKKSSKFSDTVFAVRSIILGLFKKL